MLKIVVFDSGYGGEIFADRLGEKLKVAEIIRVIDWRNSEKYLQGKREARKAAEKALLPYLGKVDLIILANYFLSISSLKYFMRKYEPQKFVGLRPTLPCKFVNNDTLILTTSCIARTINYHNYVSRLHCKTVTLALDTWPAKIDDGELNVEEIRTTIKGYLADKSVRITEIVIMCSQFLDIKNDLKRVFGVAVGIHDSFEDALTNVCRTLNLRGGAGNKIKKRKGPSVNGP